jgi:hypothetical protein
MVGIHAAASRRFPGEGSSTQGESGPKPRPRGVGDGEPVEIPVPQLTGWSEAGTQGDRRSGRMEMPVQASEGVRGEGHRTAARGAMAREVEYRSGRIPLPGKAASEGSCARTETDTGRRGEEPEARGRTPAKELGKMSP